MQRALLALLWAAATLLATAVSWVGVSTVTAAVSDTPSPTIPPARVAALMDPASTTSTTDPEATTSTVAAPLRTTTTRAAGAARHPGDEVATMPAPLPPASTTSTVPPRRTASYSTKGGSITIACDGDKVALASASPADGYQVVVDQAGPDHVDVSFRGEEEGTRIVAHCEAGNPVRDQPPPPPRDGRNGGPGPH